MKFAVFPGNELNGELLHWKAIPRVSPRSLTQKPDTFHSSFPFTRVIQIQSTIQTPESHRARVPAHLSRKINKHKTPGQPKPCIYPTSSLSPQNFPRARERSSATSERECIPSYAYEKFRPPRARRKLFYDHFSRPTPLHPPRHFSRSNCRPVFPFPPYLFSSVLHPVAVPRGRWSTHTEQSSARVNTRNAFSVSGSSYIIRWSAPQLMVVAVQYILTGPYMPPYVPQAANWAGCLLAFAARETGSFDFLVHYIVVIFVCLRFVVENLAVGSMGL